ncbi:hypothetical protein AG0111_0g1386 [Alternaria gaisen]|uniref:Uncharacterized protein n=1 Tax=Alternaria gaisen TaxID=167740 RepID=A0ACB6G1G8_9PLEO|nr:hypothetical protein AG0111_0g1386 [Alternaria gaisen]
MLERIMRSSFPTGETVGLNTSNIKQLPELGDMFFLDRTSTKTLRS